jgi:hypothetical protein
MGTHVSNLAPDSDTLVITHSHYDEESDDVVVDETITIARDEDGIVCVLIYDDEGSETRYVLGQEGYTQKL